MADDLMKQGEDGWDRASIQYRSHPLHPFPDVKPADLLLPSAANRLRLIADCITFGAAAALLLYFPLLMVSFTTTADLSRWIMGTLVSVGVVSAVLVLVAALADEREFRASL